MKAASWLVATVYVGAAALLLTWGAWLLATDDAQGGRHFVGVVVVVVAVSLFAVGLVAVRWRRRS